MYRIKGIALIVLLSCLGCGNDTPVEPEPTVNTAPKIDALILPQKVEAGSTVNLQVVARDAENDNLTINWQVSEGHVDIATAIWTAPKDGTTVEITVFVSDRSNEAVSAKKSVEVVLVELEPPAPIPEPTVEPVIEPTVEPVAPDPEPVGREEARIIPRIGLVVITPGLENVSVGIGQSMNDLEKLYGPTRPHRIDGWVRFNEPRLGAIIVSSENNVVTSIYIEDLKYKTADGIGIGTGQAEVIIAYGQPDRVNADLRLESYFAEGISFAYTDQWKVDGIFIF